MTGAVVALGLATVLMTVALLFVTRQQAGERREWRDERRQLVDRAIASHTGEILALDRATAPKVDRPDRERPQAVGL